MELVCYIRLNPLRAGMVKDLNELDRYAFSGHSTLMGKEWNDWQNADAVLGRFGIKVGAVKCSYRKFVKEGISLGRRPDLVGGGLVRSAGGWLAVKELRKAKAYVKGDERILGDGEFVDQVLLQAAEAFNHRYHLRSKGVDLGESLKSGDRAIRFKTRGDMVFGEDPKAGSGAQSAVLLGRAGTRGKHVIDVEKTECVNCGDKQVRRARRTTG